MFIRKQDVIAIEKEADSGSMNGKIPLDNWISSNKLKNKIYSIYDFYIII